MTDTITKQELKLSAAEAYKEFMGYSMYGAGIFLGGVLSLVGWLVGIPLWGVFAAPIVAGFLICAVAVIRFLGRPVHFPDNGDEQ